MKDKEKNNKFIMTADGYLKAETELNELKEVRRPDVIKALKEARAMGDLSENADYDAARNDQAMIEAKIRELEYKLEHAEIIDNIDKSAVNLGSVVTISYEDGETEEYELVGSMEVDPFKNKISNESPLGVALLNHRMGDTVLVASPNGGYNIKIEKIV